MKKDRKCKIENNELLLVEESFSKYNEDKDFTTLDAWKKARIVKIFFYKEIIPLLPKFEEYNLIIQIRKASISCTNNIAEGYGRYHHREGIQFYRISRASLYELKDDIISCLDFEYITKEHYDKGIHLIEDAKITLNGYINYTCNLLKKNKE
jgi:four helix bundle protein